MSLSSLAEEIQAAVASFLPTIQPNYTTQTLLDLTCTNKLDPAGLFEEGTIGLFICPVTNQYNIGSSNRRERVKSLTKNPVIAVVLSVPFTSTTPGDVSEWAEVSEIIDFRERIEAFIATNQWSATIESIEAEPPLELRLNTRWFMGICEFTFEAQQC